ncbi:MAG TPA: arginine deiminase-related protein [Streptosporangiaceae bacterium]|nr:arginine deiminase-related protein [Streptosporangiaceae bacterium]
MLETAGTPYPAPTDAPGTRHGSLHGRPARTYLMCPPTYFTVGYSINPWMDPRMPVDTARAVRQWEQLRQTYRLLGHTIHLIDPVPGLPDMVFAANGGTVIGGRVLGARFLHAERAAEADAYLSWFRANRYRSVREPLVINEGEGDLMCAGRAVLAGHGFRSDLAARDDIEELFGLPVVSVRLVDPRFYHLDTALCVIDANTAAYYPGAFDDAGRAAVAAQFSDLIEATEQEAAMLGLNAVSDGHHVVLAAEAAVLAAELAVRGFEPVAVDMSEFRKAGGGPKCCTLELRP